MRIDAHQHFWIYAPETLEWIDGTMEPLKRDFLPQHLAPDLAAAGFQGCIAVQAVQDIEETKWLLDLANLFQFVKGVIGWVDLRSESVEADLAQLCERKKFRGVRHVVQSEPDDRFLMRRDVMRGISKLRGFDLSYDLLVYPRQLPAASELAAKYGKQRFILDHIGKPDIKSGQIKPWAKLLKEIARHENVWCKVSGLVTQADWQDWKPEDLTPYLDVVFKAFGPERILVGSDWPVCLLAADYSDVIGAVKSYISKLSKDEQDLVLGKNALEAYAIKGPAPVGAAGGDDDDDLDEKEPG